MSEHTILCVDDEPFILKSLTRLLRRQPYQLLTAESGPAGLEMLKKHDVQVVISDQPLSYPYVIAADVLIAMYQTAYNRYIGQVREGGIVIYDDHFVSPGEVKGLKQVPIPATRTAIEEFKSEIVANMVMLGAAVKITGLVTEDALRSAVAETVAARLRELDLKAVAAGFRLGSDRPAQ